MKWTTTLTLAYPVLNYLAARIIQMALSCVLINAHHARVQSANTQWPILASVRRENASYKSEQTSCTRSFEERSDLVKMPNFDRLKPEEAKIWQLLALTMNSVIWKELTVMHCWICLRDDLHIWPHISGHGLVLLQPNQQKLLYVFMRETFFKVWGGLRSATLSSLRLFLHTGLVKTP